jgi:hypothetical protein
MLFSLDENARAQVKALPAGSLIVAPERLAEVLGFGGYADGLKSCHINWEGCPMRLLRPLFIVALVSTSVSASKIYKCVDASGRTVFSDSECGAAAEVIQYQHPESPLDTIKRELAESKEKREQEAAAREVERNKWAEFNAQQKALRAQACSDRTSQRGLAIGMERAALLRDELWQFPDDVSKTTTASGVTEYWVFKPCEGYGSVRLHITNGRLSSIHN